MSSTELALRQAGPYIPPALVEAGVMIQTDEVGHRAVMFPPALRQKFNILLPVASVTQAIPDWTPSVRVVELAHELDRYSYFNRAWGQGADKRARRALRKEALELLAEAAGIVMSKPRVVPRDQLLAREEFAFEATIGVRRHDGLIEYITRRRGWIEEVERGKIEEAVTASKKYVNNRVTNEPKFGPPHSAEWETEFRKRWHQELEYGPAKVESKAVLRAIRAALHIPQQFDESEVRKPFLVVGYSYTPDYNDPAIREVLVRNAVMPSATLYGRELEAAGEVVEEGADSAELERRAELERKAGQRIPDETDDEQGDEPEPEQTAEADAIEGEPQGPPEPDVSAEEIEQAGAVVMEAGKFKGETIASLTDANRWYVDWLAGEGSEGKVADDVRLSARIYLEANPESSE